MQSDRHARISIRAYQIWLAEGRVHGRDIEHWQQAEHEIAIEEEGMAATLADRAVKAGTPSRGRNAPDKAAPKSAAAIAKPKPAAGPAGAAKRPRRSASPAAG